MLFKLFRRKVKRTEWMRGLTEAEKNYSKDTPKSFVEVGGGSGNSLRDYYEEFMIVNSSSDFIAGYNSYKNSAFAHVV